MSRMSNAFLLATGLCIGATAHAGPNGKPFVELENEIVEVQGQVQTLADQVRAVVDRVDDIEQSVAASEAAIQTLQTAIADLQAQIDAGAGDVAALQAQIDQNTTLISALSDEIQAVTALLDEAAAIEAGQCGEGFRVVGFNAVTSEVVCQPLNVPTESSVITRRSLRIAPGQIASATLGCILETGPRRFARDLGWTLPDGVILRTVQNRGTGFFVAIQNQTAAWQTVNLSTTCFSSF